MQKSDIIVVMKNLFKKENIIFIVPVVLAVIIIIAIVIVKLTGKTGENDASASANEVISLNMHQENGTNSSVTGAALSEGGMSYTETEGTPSNEESVSDNAVTITTSGNEVTITDADGNETTITTDDEETPIIAPDTSEENSDDGNITGDTPDESGGDNENGASDENGTSGNDDAPADDDIIELPFVPADELDI